MSWLRALVPAIWLLGAFGCATSSIDHFSQQTDEWSQDTNSQVDILWVIDDSTTMPEKHALLASSFSLFADQLDAAGTDFHLDITTTSLTGDIQNASLPFLTNEDLDYQAQFVERVEALGGGGSDKEKGFEAALNVLYADPTDEPSFLRRSARLLTLFVSDEDDCSDDGALDDRAPSSCYTSADELTPVSAVVSDFRSLKYGDLDLIQMGAIVGLPDASCADVYPGARYLEAIRWTAGIVGDLCEPSWETSMSQLGLAATGIRTTFRLSHPAQIDTLSVQVDKQGIDQVKPGRDDGWTYDEVTWFLEFHGNAVPAQGASILARYTVDPTVLSPR